MSLKKAKSLVGRAAARDEEVHCIIVRAYLDAHLDRPSLPITFIRLHTTCGLDTSASLPGSRCS